MILKGPRASTLLYRAVAARSDGRPFIVPANSCPVVALAIEAAGASVVFADIDATTLGLDPDAALALVAAAPGRFGGVVFMHPYGRRTPLDAVYARLREAQPDLFLVDDRCLCRPSFDAPCPEADLTLVSTGYAKFVDLGGGGYGLVREAWRDPGGTPAWLQGVVEVIAEHTWQARIDAALAGAERHKALVNAIYRATIPREASLEGFDAWRFNVLVREPDRLVETLFAAGLFASRHYALHPAAASGSSPNAAALHERVVNLFNDRHFTAQQAERAATIVADHIGAFGASPLPSPPTRSATM